MSQTYYLRNTTSDLAGGLDFNYKLLTAVAGEATATIQIAKSATEESYGFTEPNIPNNADWETGTTVVKVKVTAENSNIWGSIRVDRVSAAGALVESSTTTAEQQFSSVAVYTFNVASKDWTAGTIGDRLRVAYVFRNAKGNAQSFDISYNTSDSSIVTSVMTEARTTKSLAYSVKSSHTPITYNLQYVIPENYPTLFSDRVNVVIANSVSATDYQHYLNLTWLVGMNNDFSDIRFAQTDGTHCSYWIESYVSGTSAIVWIKVPSASQTILYMYYGNASVSSMSDGDLTFILFDHFDGSSLNTAKWVTTNYTPTVSGSIGTFTSVFSTSVGTRAITAIDCSDWVMVEASAKTSNSSDTRFGLAPRSDVGDWYATVKAAGIIDHSSYGNWCLYTYTEYNAILTKDSNYHRFKIKGKSGSKPIGYIDGSAGTTTVYASNTLGTAPVYYWVNNGYGWANPQACFEVDWIFIRKSGATEPTLVVSNTIINPSLTYAIKHPVAAITKGLGYKIIKSPTRTYGLTYVAIRIGITCSPLSGTFVPFTVTLSGASTIPQTTWEWDFGDGNISTITTAATTVTESFLYQYTTYRTYNISLTTGGTTDSIAIPITTDYRPTPEFYVNKVTGTFPLTVVFENVTYDVTGAATWDWDFGDGTAHSSEKNPTHTYVVSSDYTVTLKAYLPMILPLTYCIHSTRQTKELQYAIVSDRTSVIPELLTYRVKHTVGVIQYFMRYMV